MAESTVETEMVAHDSISLDTVAETESVTHDSIGLDTTGETEMVTHDSIGLDSADVDLPSVQSVEDDKSKDSDDKPDVNDTNVSKFEDIINADDMTDSNFEDSKKDDDSDIGVASLLKEGAEFDSYHKFQVALQQYSDTTFATFAHHDSSTIERLGDNAKEYNKNIVYTHVVFVCIYGGKKMPSKSNGIRNCSSRKIGCPVRLRLSSTPDRQRLVIKESKLDCHNHDLSEENYRFRTLDEETEMEIYKLISMHENKRVARQLVRDKLAKETGKNVNMKDISNIEKRVSKKIDKQQVRDDKEEKSTPDCPDAAGDDTNDNSSPENMSEEEQEDQKECPQEEQNSSPKVSSPPSTRSPARPKRQIREPKRFRDSEGSKTDTEATPLPGTGDEERMMRTRTPRVSITRMKVDPQTPAPAPTETVTPKVERRGRKRKIQPEPKPVEETVLESEKNTPDRKSVEVNGKLVEVIRKSVEVNRKSVEVNVKSVGVKKKSMEVDGKLVVADVADRKSEIRERKLAIQEELLLLEKKKMEILEVIERKLDKVLENQEKG